MGKVFLDSTALVDSSVVRWRRGLLTLCGSAVILWAFSLFQASVWHGTAGIVHDYTAVAFHDVITGVAPASAGAGAGIRPGDTVDLRVASAADRWRFRHRWLPDRASTYLVLRGAGERRVTFEPRHEGIGISLWIFYAGAFGALVFATLIAWRRPQLIQARVLCLLLLASVVEPCLGPSKFVTPWPALDFAAALLDRFILEAFVLVVYTMLFARPLSAVRKFVIYFTFFYLGFDTVCAFGETAGTWTGTLDLFGGPIGTAPLYQLWEPLLGYTLILLNVALAFGATRDQERALLAWTMTLPFINFAVAFLEHVPALNAIGPLAQVFDYFGAGTVFLSPFAMGYALLARRLLDVGFVLNRAAVFSAVSLIVIAAFILVEWALGGWLSTANRATNLVVAGGLALLLGFFMHRIHGRVDNLVDRVFFGKRRRDQDAIAAFSREAPYVTEKRVLLERTEETLTRHIDASSVEILLDDRRGRYGWVSENDPAVLALRARHDVLDLHDVAGDIRGDYALPVVSRGRVLGVLVLGHKRSGESYAPDELEVTLRLAHALGSALDVLSHDRVADPSLAKLDAVCEMLAKIGETQTAILEAVRQPEPGAT